MMPKLAEDVRLGVMMGVGRCFEVEDDLSRGILGGLSGIEGSGLSIVVVIVVDVLLFFVSFSS
jgi:hypothetical protein